MRVTVETLRDSPIRPQQRVILNMSVEEFAMLESLRWSSLQGHCALRTRIESGFESVLEHVSGYWREKIENKARTARGDADLVQRIMGKEARA